MSNKTYRGDGIHGIEMLEGRLLLNGHVTATLVGTDLVLHGDSSDNQILITQTTAGSFHVEGTEGTTVNGKASADVTNVTGDLNIQLRHGTDSVTVEGPMTIPDDLRAKMGAGELIVEGSSGPIKIGDDVNIKTATEGTVTLRNDIQIGGNLVITGGGDVTATAGLAATPVFSTSNFSHPLTINNPLLPWVVGSVYKYRDTATDTETDETTTSINTVEVLNQTKVIDGVTTRVVHDFLTEDGLVTEDTQDYYAQDNGGNVWYFGEATTEKEYDDNGNLIGTSTAGSWLAGENGAQPGIVMEANPRVGFRYAQEFRPGVDAVLDEGEGLATGQTATAPFGTFNNLYETRETGVSEPFGLGNKYYEPGIGSFVEVDLDIEDHKVIEPNELLSLQLNGKDVTQVVPTTGFTGSNAAFAPALGILQVTGSADITAAGGIYLGAAKINDGLTVHGGDTVVLVDVAINGNSALFSNDNITLNRVTAAPYLFIGGDPDMDIYSSNITALKGRFGSGNNSLAVTGSKFGSFDVDGRGGSNSLKDRGGNDFGTTTLRHFVRA